MEFIEIFSHFQKFFLTIIIFQDTYEFLSFSIFSKFLKQKHFSKMEFIILILVPK